MMENLTINEVRVKAAAFSRKYEKVTYERGEAHSFYDDFFKVFGNERFGLAVFEEHVKKLNDKDGWIDLFWPKNLLAEHKSAGKDLDDAMKQAKEYFSGLEPNQMPPYLLACDFQNFKLVDLYHGKEWNFTLASLSKNVELFPFMRGIPQQNMTGKTQQVVNVDPVNMEASEKLGEIYKGLKKNGYPDHHMEYFLTRLTYCLFADDTGIFEPNMFHNFLLHKTKIDGSDLGPKLIELFGEALNKKNESRQSNLDEEIAKFRYINGDLFSKTIDTPAFNSEMRLLLIEVSGYDWKNVTPSIFGSLFQSVMDKKERRSIGGHFTGEPDILKVIYPLFLDDLREEFEQIKSITDGNTKNKLEKFQDKLGNLKFFDPACGAGNFLIVAYREIRRLEMKVIKELYEGKTDQLDVSSLSKVNVDQFYGIEIKEFSAQIARTALWMMDHIMNNELSEKFGQLYQRLPLEKHPHIRHDDALEIDWNDVLPASQCSYILGNPPYGGNKKMNKKQKNQVQCIANIGKSGGILDYVCAWFLKAGEYVNSVKEDKEKKHFKVIIPFGFVATKSITQGEQVRDLWRILFEKHYLNIIFAHKQFKWISQSPGKPAVRVVILGLSKDKKKKKRLIHFEGDAKKEENPKYISPYLINSNKELITVRKVTKPINGLPKMELGSQPLDDRKNHYYLFTDEEKVEFLAKEPDAESLFKPFMGADDFLYNKSRWILDLHGVKPQTLQNLPEVMKRMDAVKSYRSKRDRIATKNLADFPTKWGIETIPREPFLAIPRHTSEIRYKYLPMGYLEPPIIPGDSISVIENAEPELFGLLTSKMHMVWLRVIGGSLEGRVRYSEGVVYGTFPLPKAGFESLKHYAEEILDLREKHTGTALADLYMPLIMPEDLKKAHIKLDNAVDKLYRVIPFENDDERIEFLLTKYKEMSEALIYEKLKIKIPN